MKDRTNRPKSLAARRTKRPGLFSLNLSSWLLVLICMVPRLAGKPIRIYIVTDLEGASVGEWVEKYGSGGELGRQLAELGAKLAQHVQVLAAKEEDAGAFRSQHPLVPVGRQEVNLRLVYIKGKHAQPLNCIEEKERAAIVGKLRHFRHVDSPAGGVADPATRELHGRNSAELILA